MLSHLVQSTCALVLQTLRIVKGTHNRKTAAFVRAACGYCYITIPTVISFWTRLSLYLLASEVALLNNCLPQAESMLVAATTLISEGANLSGTTFVSPLFLLFHSGLSLFIHCLTIFIHCLSLFIHCRSLFIHCLTKFIQRRSCRVTRRRSSCSM